MKKPFKKQGKMLFDETINTSFEPALFTGKQKKLTKKQKEKCLADLGSGSETEYESARILCEHFDTSSKLLDFLIECCEKKGTYLDSHLAWSFIGFQDDERVLPAIIKSVSKCPDEKLSNYPALLGVFGGKEAKKVLKKRFHNLKNNSKAFAKCKDWNDLGFSLMDICVTLLEVEPDNIEVVECLVKLSKHPNSFNQEIAISRISLFYKTFTYLNYSKTRIILAKALESFSRTNNPSIFGRLLPYLFQTKPEKTYQKFKKLYLKTKKEDRYHNLASSLIYSVDNSLIWICRLVRELPKEDSEYFRGYLNWNMVNPMNNRELVFAIKEEFAAESPNTRISSIEKLKHLNINEAKKILKEALADEPDKFIRKEFEKHLRKLEKLK